jgi:linoleoyl-CoA desaturase
MKSKIAVRFISPEKTDFFKTLRSRVDNYFKENNISPFATSSMIIKSIIMLLAYLAPFVLLLTLQPGFWIAAGLWLLMGIAMAGIGMSVMHDANHGAYSKNEKVNKWMGLTVNLCGASAFNWKIQHNIMHHTFTNISDYDEDIEDKLILKFNPHTQLKWYHRFQWLVSFVLYGILTLYWVTVKDFVQFKKYIKNGVNKNSKKHNAMVLAKIIVLKIVYFFSFLVLPVFLGIPFLHVLIGFLGMHFVAGIILSTIFQLAHTVEGTSHPLPNKEGIIENDWAIHQLNTTTNFCRGNKFLSWYLGGLNHQVEHHLFFRISHVHYPALSVIVKNTAEEYHIPYLENKTFLQALGSHVRALRKMGRLPKMNEIMD